MTLAVSLTRADVYTRLKALLTDVLPAGIEVVQGQGNRVAMPTGNEYVVMTANLLTPHRTPVVEWDKNDPDADEIRIEQGTLVRIQLDCYGERAQDWAVILCTVLRNGYSVQFLTPLAPLFADNPVQAPLIDAEQQYNERWIVGANVQYNPVVTAPQEFANAAEAEIINVDVSYPP